MSQIVSILGPPASGKSASARTLDPEETFIVSCAGKTPPWQGWTDGYSKFSKENKQGNFFELDVAPRQMSNRLEWILKNVSKKRDDVKTIVVDDFQYVMSFEFMDRALENGWDKFSEMGVNVFDVIDTARRLRDDIVVVFLSHSASKTDASHGKEGFKTIGKMLDKRLDLEGLFNVILFTVNPDVGVYKFLTKTDGQKIARAPMGMFDDFDGALIPNDLGMVVDRIRDHNQI